MGGSRRLAREVPCFVLGPRRRRPNCLVLTASLQLTEYLEECQRQAAGLALVRADISWNPLPKRLRKNQI